MKIGVFDSGLGGLIIFKELVKKFPKHDFVYLGDVKRLPYGTRSDETIFEFTKQAVEYLFNEKDCKLVILACNTASARALRRIQQEILPVRYPNRRVLGVIVPTVEEAIDELRIKNYEPASPAGRLRKNKKERIIGVLATSATVNSRTFKIEINKLDKEIKVYEKSAPSLVTLIENGEIKFVEPLLRNYLKPLLVKKIDTLVLGCTHYPIVKNLIKKIVGKKTCLPDRQVKIISQEEIIPKKLADYLMRHPEIDSEVSKNGNREILVTEITDGFKKLAKKWLGREVELKVTIL